MENAIALGCIALAVWAWASSIQAREQALRRCRAACRELGVQFLDETVRIERLALARDREGRLRLRRWYTFELSVSGADRHRGLAVLLGPRLEHLRVDLPEGPVIVE